MKISVKEENGKIHVVHTQDIEAVIKANHDQLSQRSVFDRKGEFNHIMRVPHVVLMEIQQKYNLDFFDKDDAKVILGILKSPEYSVFRTAPGKL